MEDLQAVISRAKLAVSVILEDHPNEAKILYSSASIRSNPDNLTGNTEHSQAASSRAELAVSKNYSSLVFPHP